MGGSGWLPIKHNHVDHPSGNQFEQYGSQYREDEEAIKRLIVEAAQNGDETLINNDIWRVYTVPDSGGRLLHILVGDNGYIVTTMPMPT